MTAIREAELAERAERIDRLRQLELRQTELEQLFAGALRTDEGQPHLPSAARMPPVHSAASPEGVASSAQQPPPVDRDVLDHPLVLSMQKQLEDQKQQLAQARSEAEAMVRKAEALARNLVRALKERNAFEEALRSRASESTRSTGPPTDEIQLRDDEFRAKDEELRRCYRELERLASIRAVAASSSGALGAGRVVERDPTAIETLRIEHDQLLLRVRALQTAKEVAESQRNTLANELQLSATCIEQLDQRLSVSEQELLHARLSATRTVEEELTSIDLAAVPLSVRKQIARLMAEVSTLTQQVQLATDESRARQLFAEQTTAEVKAHSQRLQEHVVLLLEQLDEERVLHEDTKRELANARAVVKRLVDRGSLCEQLLATTQGEIVALLNEDGAAASGSPAAVGRVRSFIRQASRDFNVMRELLEELSEAAVRLFGNPPAALTAPLATASVESHVVAATIAVPHSTAAAGPRLRAPVPSAPRADNESNALYYPASTRSAGRTSLAWRSAPLNGPREVSPSPHPSS